MSKQRAIIGFLCLLMAVVCVSSRAQAQDRELNVISTNSIVADWVRQVGGDLIKQSVLVGADSDPHTFEPTPQETVLLKEADIVFEIGLHLEPWLDKLYESSDSKAMRYRLTQGLMLIHMDGLKRGETEIDPHVWHDIGSVIMMVQAICNVLMDEDPAHEAQYRKNTEAYLKQLSDLDVWIFDEVIKIPNERRKLVTSHDTFRYFARRYGFQIIGAVIESATTEAADPSAAQIAQLVEKVKSAGVPAIFVENVANPQMVNTVAKEANVSVAPELYSDALGKQGSEGDDYLKMMKYNVETIVGALK